jgi:hypothetical protein
MFTRNFRPFSFIMKNLLEAPIFSYCPRPFCGVLCLTKICSRFDAGDTFRRVDQLFESTCAASSGSIDAGAAYSCNDITCLVEVDRRRYSGMSAS